MRHHRSSRTAVVALLLTTTTILLASGCSAASPSATPNQTHVTLVQGAKGNPFYTAMACGAEDSATKLGVVLDVAAPDQFDASLQTPVVNAVAAKQPNGVLIAPTDAVAMRTPVKQLVDSGVKVVEVDTALQDTSVSFAHITTDNAAAGRAAADYFNKVLGGKGDILALSSAPGISTNDDRVNNLKKALTGYPGLRFGGIQYTKEDATIAASVVAAALAADPAINGVFSVNSPSTQGAATALKNAGVSGRVKLVGFDAGLQQVQQLRQGDVAALVAQSPYQIGADGVRDVVDALAGKAVAKSALTPVMVLDKDNLSSPQAQNFVYKTGC